MELSEIIEYNELKLNYFNLFALYYKPVFFF